MRTGAAAMSTPTVHLSGLTTYATLPPMAAWRILVAMLTTTTVLRTPVTSLPTGRIPPVNTALRITARTVFQAVQLTMSVLPSSQFVESQGMTTGVDVLLILTVLDLGPTSFVTLIQMVARRVALMTQTAQMMSVT